MNRRELIAAATATALLGARAPEPTSSASPGPLAESDATLATPTGKLHGTLAIPAGVVRPPIVVIVAGSGPIDRDGNATAVGLRTDTYELLAAALGRRGIATLRYDKRGVAASRDAGLVEADARFETYAADAAAWIAQLRTDARLGAVSIVGHSEGSTVGMLAAVTAMPDAFVSLEGPGFPAAVVVRRQTEPRLANAPLLLAANDRILKALERGATTANVPPELMVLYRPSVQPYLISLFRIDPRVAIKNVPGRVAIVQGSYDVQVGVGDARALAAARPDATLHLVEHMSHMLKDADVNTLASQATTVYADPSLPLDPAVAETIATMVRAGAA